MGERIRAVLFDFDGLILDTETPDVRAWQTVFERHGHEFPDWCWIQMIGRSLHTVDIHPLDLLEEMAGGPIDREAVIVERRKIRRSLIEDEKPLPGVCALLDQVAEAGLRAAIVSSSDRAWIEGHLSRVGLLDRFERIICGFEGLPSKPDPALYKAALDQMNLKADEAIALEDSPNGIAAATEAGIYTIAIPNGLTARLPLDRAQSVLASLEGVALAELYPA